MSADGRWDTWYRHGTQEKSSYVNTMTYGMGAEFLGDCERVEDWGCGLAWFSTLYKGEYIGVDGSCSPHATVQADLREYRSDVDGIFMRHVLEHNDEWQRILDNAIASFRRRMCLVLFTPLHDETCIVGQTTLNGVDIPDYSFRIEDITDRRAECTVATRLNLESPETLYGVEHVVFFTKGGDY